MGSDRLPFQVFGPELKSFGPHLKNSSDAGRPRCPASRHPCPTFLVTTCFLRRTQRDGSYSQKQSLGVHSPEPGRWKLQGEAWPSTVGTQPPATTQIAWPRRTS